MLYLHSLAIADTGAIIIPQRETDKRNQRPVIDSTSRDCEVNSALNVSRRENTVDVHSTPTGIDTVLE